MSLIHDLLTSISKNPGITAQELAEELKQDLNRVRNNLYVNKNLIITKRDDVTRRPGYHLTSEGKAKVKAGANDQDDVAPESADPAPQPAAAAAPAPSAARPTDALTPAEAGITTESLQAQIGEMLYRMSRLRAENAQLNAQLRAAEEARTASPAPKAAPAPVGYLITAPKRKPRRFTSRTRAADAALKAVRAGAARADVFALIPAGTARRGVEWTASQES